MKKIWLFFLILELNICNNNKHAIKQNIDIQKNNNTAQTKYFNFNKEKKNLILSTIVKYPLDIILPFFKSFIRVNFKNCDIVMFIKDVSQSIIEYLKSIGVITYNISKNYKNIEITKLRWKLYIDFLKKKKNEYNLIFIADVRDTIFQKDIFQYYRNYKPFIGLAIEDGTLNQGFTKIWLIGYIGIEKHKTIKNQRIICFGSIWGTPSEILEFSIILWDNVKMNKNSTDQGIGNYLFYYEKFFNSCFIKSDNYGPVMTIGRTKRANIELDTNNNILNFGGEIAAVVHQYDRKPDIVTIIKNKFLCSNKTKVTNIKISNKKNIRYISVKLDSISFYLSLQFLVIILLIRIVKKKN
jgi:hypothetical protein